VWFSERQVNKGNLRLTGYPSPYSNLAPIWHIVLELTYGRISDIPHSGQMGRFDQSNPGQKNVEITLEKGWKKVGMMLEWLWNNAGMTFWSP